MKNFAEYAPKLLAAGALPQIPLGELKRSPKPPVATLGALPPRARALCALESPTLSNGKCPPHKMKSWIRPDRQRQSCRSDVARSVSRFQHGRPHDASSSSRCVLQSSWRCAQLVQLLPRWSHAVCPQWKQEVETVMRYVWGTTRVGAQSDPISLVHGRPTAPDPESWFASTFIRWWPSDIWFL